jgi:hypothetical protein
MKTLSLLLCALVALVITCQAQTDTPTQQLPPPTGDQTQQQLPQTGDNLSTANTTYKVYGAPVPGDAKLYALREAFPMAKNMLGQKILLMGQVGKLVNTPPHWINMVDGMARVEIQTFIQSLPGVRDTQTIQCYGAFEMQKVPLGLKLVFTAISIRIK